MRKTFILLASLILSQVAQGDNITFADSHVKSICVEHWDTDGDGELSEEEAAVVLSLHHYFSSDTQVSSFNELKYFTDLISITSSEFYGCSYLKSIQLPPQVKSIGDNAFRNCVRLLTVDIPSSVETIYESAFNGCVRMVNVTFHEGLAFIDNLAFFSCKSLQSINIPSSLTSLASTAFKGCNSVESISVANDNTVYDSREDCNAIILTETNTMVLGCSNASFPETVTSIGNAAFSGCTNLIELDVPETIVSIGPSAFSNCSGLVSVHLPSSISIIENGVFSECTKLTEVHLPEGLMRIGVSAFGQCRNLPSISIPASVTTISANAFFECPKLLDVTVGFSTPISITSTTFPNRQYATLHVPPGCVQTFKETKYWKDFYLIVESFPMGDVNMDGSVTVTDVMLTINHVLNNKPDNFHEQYADMNSDGRINVADIMLIVKKAIGQ